MSDHVYYQHKRHTVLGRVRFRGRRLSVLEYLSANKQVMRVFEHRQHLPGMVRCLRAVPWSKRAQEHLRLIARLSDSDLPTPSIIDSERQGDNLLVLSEWKHGRPVAQLLSDARRGREPWPSVPIVVNLSVGFIRVLKVLHERINIVHGDINRNNVIITKDTRRLVPIDYGSAWYTETTMHRDQGDGVSRCYAAPEHWMPGERVSFLSDQFSAAAVLYELMTGEVPYDGLGGRVAMLSAEQPVPSLLPPSAHLQHKGQLPANCKRLLDAVMMTSLQLEPKRRYETTSAWLRAMCALRDELVRQPTMTKANSYLLRFVERMFG